MRQIAKSVKRQVRITEFSHIVNTTIRLSHTAVFWATGAAWGRGRDPSSLTQSLSLSLSIHVADTAATSQDGCILRMQGSEGCAAAKV